jgi:hypothetical protein
VAGSIAILYGLDLLILLLAMGAALAAHGERHRWPVPRGRLLLPGLLATLGSAILLVSPEIRDATLPHLGTVGLAGLATGALRGRLMTIDADHIQGAVRLHRGQDGAWAGWTMAACAAIQSLIETGLPPDNLYEASAELLMVLCSGYLLGRSLIAWLRAGRLPPLAAPT